jgi:hypothetical protein
MNRSIAANPTQKALNQGVIAFASVAVAHMAMRLHCQRTQTNACGGVDRGRVRVTG